MDYITYIILSRQVFFIYLFFYEEHIHRNWLVEGFYLNAHIARFHPESQKLEQQCIPQGLFQDKNYYPNTNES